MAGCFLPVSATGHHHGAVQYLAERSELGCDEGGEQVRVRVVEQAFLVDPEADRVRGLNDLDVPTADRGADGLQ